MKTPTSHLKKKSIVESPNLLELGLVSKSTLKHLGYKIKDQEESEMEKETYTEAKSMKETTEVPISTKPHQVESVIEDSFIDDSPICSILKKPPSKKNEKLNAPNESRVEISPGLFVKRPSSKTKPPPVEINQSLSPPPPPILKSLTKNQTNPKNEQQETEDKIPIIIKKTEPESPQLPSLKTINLQSLMINDKTSSKSNTLIKKDKDSDTPEMPTFHTEEARKLSSKKSNVKTVKDQDKENNEKVSPQLPQLNTYEAQVFLSSKKPSRSRKEDPGSPIIPENSIEIEDSPQMPSLQTVNLASIIQKAKGTYL